MTEVEIHLGHKGGWMKGFSTRFVAIFVLYFFLDLFYDGFFSVYGPFNNLSFKVW